MVVVAGKDIGTNDLLVVGGGAVLLVASFLPWSGSTVCVDGQCSSLSGYGGGGNGYNSGFLGWAGVLLVLAVAVVVALRIFTTVRLPTLPVPEPMALVAVAALGTLLVLLKLLLGYRADYLGTSVSISRGLGLYLSAVAAVVVTAGAALGFRAGGGKVSDFRDVAGGLTSGGAGGAGGTSPQS